MNFIEDCEVCCNPIDFNIKVNNNDLASLVMVKNPPHNTNGDFSLDNKRIPVAILLHGLGSNGESILPLNITIIS